ncbi:MAG: helix-turn-helix domain-containing protein [Planctomycetes bacterium]|nr:helix-turn-helix domain-containing protein [Planctomycetota bacterium]
MRRTNETDAGSAPALDRGLALLDLLAGSFRKGASAAQLQDQLKVPRASLYRLLKPLCARRLVEQDPRSGLYRLGRRTLEVGYLAREAVPLVREVKPILREITQATHQMSELCVAVGRWELMMMDVWLAERTPAEVLARSGLLFQLNHLVAHGLVYLACDGERRVPEYLARMSDAEQRRQLGLSRTPPGDLAERCARVRDLGWTMVSQPHPDIARARVSVPVFDPHASSPRLAGALGVVFASTEYSPRLGAEWAGVLRTHARALERLL